MRRAFIIAVAALVLLAGCGQVAHVPVINKSPDRSIPTAYRVKAGDSLYKIAWAFGLDYLDIAKWNGIKAPYLLHPGQTLSLVDSSASTRSSPKPVVVTNRLPQKSPPPPRPRPDAKVVTFNKTPSKWNWPAEGRLAGKFSPNKGNNGIQIAGEAGSPVKATAAGEVVYAGRGLRGYGNLVILKHSTEFLSAYAHNEEIRVKEGQAVDSGQRIASMGSSDSDQPMLHFEIRKDGEPVDPLRYLTR